ncbi:hypothetical protein HRG_004365 [Hirsutella rhossiliensis]|uniref:Uncharacterized protein n=1 Tax=Hirsutella rhossiliensis TaxID=111463 RepID=A0A9P8MZP1_9HYPO|nr:uncharacterized protein HRG_04365 [Hirsutella rhossiliensis]KAH0963937.1 hypothetical protein HRG_04365 [Hirsutella rhossiliensis]
MCFEHKIVAAGCGHLLDPYKELCSAAPADYPEMPCENTLVYMTILPQFCNFCLENRTRIWGFGKAFSSLCNKKALNTYWKDLAKLNNQGAAKTPKLRDEKTPARGIDKAAYSHWKSTITLFVTEARPLQVVVGTGSWWDFNWAAGSPWQGFLAAIAREAIEKTLKLTPDFDEDLDKAPEYCEDNPEEMSEEMDMEMHEEMVKTMSYYDFDWEFAI